MTKSWRAIQLTFLGGALGTFIRYQFVLLFGNLTALFLVNILGSIAIGIFNGSKKFESENSKLFWAVGFAGGFTTMSGIAAVVFIDSVSNGWFTYLVALLFFALGLFAYWASLTLTRKLSHA